MKTTTQLNMGRKSLFRKLFVLLLICILSLPFITYQKPPLSFGLVAEEVVLIKTANEPMVYEPGGDITFNITIENNGEETIEVTSLLDSAFGDLNGQGTIHLPITINPGEFYTGDFSEYISGNAFETHTNIVTATYENESGEVFEIEDGETVHIENVMPEMEFTKTVFPESVPEPGADVTYTFSVLNTGTVEITLYQLEDDFLGDLDDQGDIDLPQTISPGESYSGTVITSISGNAGEDITNTATAYCRDYSWDLISDHDQATVTIYNVPPVMQVTKMVSPISLPESGGDVTYTYFIQNHGEESFWLYSLYDDKLWDLNGQGDISLPQDIPPGGSYIGTVPVSLSGNAGNSITNTVVAECHDDDGSGATDTDDATVVFEDILPAIQLTKTADPTSLSEPGGEVTYTFTVENTGLEMVTLTSLMDDVLMDLNGQGTIVLPQTIPPGGSYSGSVESAFSGDAGDIHTNTATAECHDDEGNVVSDDDDATVVIDDVLPTIKVEKSCDPEAVPETGGLVRFFVRILNQSIEGVNITSVVDSEFGDLVAEGVFDENEYLPAGADVLRSFERFVSGDVLVPHINTVSATAQDNEGNLVSSSGSTSVRFIDVLPQVSVVKEAMPNVIPETGQLVDFTFTISNDGLETATIASVIDSAFDNLNVEAGVPRKLFGGESFSFIISHELVGEPNPVGHTNTVTVGSSDNELNYVTCSDDESVEYVDVLPDLSVVKTAVPNRVPETGGYVNFIYEISNNSLEDVEITSVFDSVFGDLAVEADLPESIAGGDSMTFEILKWITGDASGPAHSNDVTVVGQDNEGNTDSVSDSESVEFDDVLPEIKVEKWTDLDSVLETGEEVTFTYKVSNLGYEAVTIASVIDTEIEGLSDLAGLPVELLPGENLLFSKTQTIGGDYESHTPHINEVIAEGYDNEGNTVSVSSHATVEFIDVAASIDIVKSIWDGSDFLDANEMPGPYLVEGSNPLYRIEITNNSIVPLIIDEFYDDPVITEFYTDLVLMSPADLIGEYVSPGETITVYAEGSWAGMQQMDTIHVTGSFYDGAGVREFDTAMDDAYYYGMKGNQPSIEIDDFTIMLDQERMLATGEFIITDESEKTSKADGFMVAIEDYRIDWFLKEKRNEEPLDHLIHDFEFYILEKDGFVLGTPYRLAPGEDVIFDEQVTFAYSYVFKEEIPKGATLKGTVWANIFGRLKEYMNTMTYTVPKK